jgi:predicted nucleic acid-binding Zn ribbon protein
MPYFDYECKTCGRVFEAFQPMNEEPLDHIAHMTDNDYLKVHSLNSCYGPVERKISVPSLKFVGSGFFVNDYKNK